MLTAISTVLGLIPIASTVFWGPMAFAIMGGLLVATLLTLVFLPTLYVTAFGGRPDAPAPSGAPASDGRASRHLPSTSCPMRIIRRGYLLIRPCDGLNVEHEHFLRPAIDSHPVLAQPSLASGTAEGRECRSGCAMTRYRNSDLDHHSDSVQGFKLVETRRRPISWCGTSWPRGGGAR